MTFMLQFRSSTKYGFKVCTAQMAFNSIINIALRNKGKKEQMLTT
jgi:hypothetical protein